MERLRPEQIDAAALTLAEAFRDDPLLTLLHPDERKRADIAPWLFGTAIKIGLPYEQVWANEDASAVAVWLPPEGANLSVIGLLRAGMAALPLKVGLRQTIRFVRAISRLEPFHKAVGGPHWYLASIGTRPERQRQGLGNALLEVGTSQADAAGLPCYLETLTDEDIAFYSKRGFVVTGQAEAQGLTLSAMVRPAQPRSAD